MKNKSELVIKLGVSPDTMTEAELLACVLSKNPAERETRAAQKLLKLGALSAETSPAYSSRLRAAKELGKRLAAKKPGMFLKPADVWVELKDLRENKKEHFVVFFLDTRNGEIKRDIVSIGTLNYNLVHPREVFYPAVKNLAASVILCHNHPSGCLEPSDEDLTLTKRLVQAGKIMGIEVLDHVIVSKDGWMSFKQKNLM